MTTHKLVPCPDCDGQGHYVPPHGTAPEPDHVPCERCGATGYVKPPRSRLWRVNTVPPGYYLDETTARQAATRAGVGCSPADGSVVVSRDLLDEVMRELDDGHNCSWCSTLADRLREALR